jgi:hypothetical protein
LKNHHNHIIRQQELEIHFENLEDAIGLQDRVAELFYQKLQPEMEKLFDEIAGEKYLVKLDKLEIDCGFLSDKNWEQLWVENTLRNLRSELVAAHRKSTFDVHEHASEGFLFFLEHGYFSWNNRMASVTQLEQMVLINDALISKLKKLLQHSSNASERLTYQFSEKFRKKIITAFTANNIDSIQTIQLHLNMINLDQHIVDAAILKAYANESPANIVHQFFTDVYSKVDTLSRPVIEEILEKYPETETKNPTPETKIVQMSLDAIYISNAGLILLHPFFTELYEQLGLTTENHWMNSRSQHKAAVIMQFIVTGHEELPEYDLPLNKILCGLDIEDVIIPTNELSYETKTECEDLLHQTIKHWSVLKNTGIEGLRETFIQRNGKLSKVDKGWLLQVEQKSMDILMSHLPWGIGLIKTPWMQEMLYVEWT